MVLNRVAYVSILLPWVMFGQDATKLAHVVRATGEATVSAKPDRAEISVGVLTHAPTAEAASAQNASQTSEVLKQLKQVLGARGEIKTSGYSIGADYQYASGKPPKIAGYHANNSVLVTVNDLFLVGKIIDAATGSGANNVNGISFSLRDDEVVRAQALTEAARKARANAEAIARGLDLHVIRVLRAEATEASPIRPLVFKAEMAMAQASTPIESGTLDIHATVTVTLEVQ